MSEFKVHEAARAAWARVQLLTGVSESDYEFAFCSGYEYAKREQATAARCTTPSLDLNAIAEEIVVWFVRIDDPQRSKRLSEVLSILQCATGSKS